MSEAHSKFPDLTNQVFDFLTALYRTRDSSGRWAWMCRCRCGGNRIVRGDDLRRRQANISCGCRHRRHFRQAVTTHGRSGTAEYRSWQAMKDRCNNPSNQAYRNYGGRGITVCREWNLSFEQFFADVGPRPTAKHSLERINNDGDYEPENVIWAMKAQQERNKRTNHNLTFHGRTQSLTDWARELGLCTSTIHGRLQSGWTVEQSLTAGVTPVELKHVHLLTAHGDTKSLAEWARANSLKAPTILARLRYGWCAECAVVNHSKRGFCPHR